MKNKLSFDQTQELLITLKSRFEKNIKRHEDLDWLEVHKRLEAFKDKLWSLYLMEKTGGEPDVVGKDSETGEFIIYDCSEESPKGRRSFCYDQEALISRKENKPENSAMGMALEMGIRILSESEYVALQKLGNFDTKTSSWVSTPSEVRKLGGALFCDYRYGKVFLYHNGAESYYAARGFRGSFRV